MKKAAIYIRVSTEEQLKGHSVEGQEEEVRKRVLDDGFLVYKKYIDEGISGTSDNRPALNQLVADAEENKFECLYTWSFDRLFRDAKKMLTFVDKISELGIEIVSIVDNIKDVKEERLNLTIRAAFAEDERKKILKRTELGRMMAAKQGKWMGGEPPYGYSLDKENSKLIINPDEAKNVRKFYKWLIREELTLYGLQRKVNQLKIPTRGDNRGRKRINAKGFWMERTLGRILTNEVYTGVFYYRKYQKPRGSNKRVLREEKDWIPIEVPKIVNIELFELVQRQLHDNKKFAKKRAKQEYMLARLIECGKCGRKWFSSYNNKMVKYYGCPGRRARTTSEVCDACHVKCEKIDNSVWERIHSLLNQPALLVSQAHKLAEKNNNLGELKEEYEILIKRFSRLKAEEDRLLLAYKSGKIDLEVLEDSINETREEKDKLEMKIFQIKGDINNHKTQKEQISIVKDYSDTIKQNLDNLTYSDKTYICRKVLEKVVVKNNLIEVYTSIPIMAYQDYSRVG